MQQNKGIIQEYEENKDIKGNYLYKRRHAYSKTNEVFLEINNVCFMLNMFIENEIKNEHNKEK